jgi:hypothetical protein
MAVSPVGNKKPSIPFMANRVPVRQQFFPCLLAAYGAGPGQFLAALGQNNVRKPLTPWPALRRKRLQVCHWNASEQDGCVIARDQIVGFEHSLDSRQMKWFDRRLQRCVRQKDSCRVDIGVLEYVTAMAIHVDSTVGKP